MKVLVACEEWGLVRDELLNAGIMQSVATCCPAPGPGLPLLMVKEMCFPSLTRDGI